MPQLYNPPEKADKKKKPAIKEVTITELGVRRDV